MPLHIINGDIFDFKGKVDAIVVPANKKPVTGFGLDSMMFRAAGYKNVMEQRKAMGDLRLGQAKATDGFRLAGHLIHTASPMWLGGASEECEKLKSCYINSIKCADLLGLKSIAFPLLSSGNMRFPYGTAYETAVHAINERLGVHDSLDVYLVIYRGDNEDEFIKAENIYMHSDSTLDELKKLQSDLSHIRDPDREVVWYLTNVTDHIAIRTAKETQIKSFEKALPVYLAKNPGKNIDDFKHERICEYFENCGISAAKLAEMICCEKSTISRIKNGQTKTPRKTTMIALAIAMGLSTEQRYDLIKCSGHAYPIDNMDCAVEQLILDGFRNVKYISDVLYRRNHAWLLTGNRSDELVGKKDPSPEK
ncbi:MAG: macro domain-containing protein [Oscillospiraceae bacterium]